MPDEPEDEAVKKVEAEFDNFGKRTQKWANEVGDLSLCMRTCKTPEVKLTLAEATRRAIAELEREKSALENQIKKQLELAAKQAEKAKKAKKPAPPGKGAKPPDTGAKKKSAQLKYKLMVEKFNKKYLPNDHSVWLEFQAKPKNEPPFVDPKKSSVILRYEIKF